VFALSKSTALVMTAVELAHFAVRIAVVSRVAGLRLSAPLLAVGRPALAAALMAVPMAALTAWLARSPHAIPAGLVLAVALPVGLTGYLAALRVVAPELLRRGMAVGRAFLTTRARARA